MSAEQKGQKDGEVVSEGDSLRRLLYRAGLIALAPALLAFFWLGLIREPLIQSGTATSLAQATVESRADMVGLSFIYRPTISARLSTVACARLVAVTD